MKLLRLFAVTLAFMLPAAAQTPEKKGPITMELNSPFNLTPAAKDKSLTIVAKPRHWMPVAVLLTNTGDPVTGTLRLKLTSSAQFEKPKWDYYVDVELPTTSRKVVWLYAYLQEYSIDGLEVSFSGRGIQSQTARGMVRPLDFGQRLVLNVTDGDDTLAYMAQFKSERLLKAQPSQWMADNQIVVRPVNTPREMVPDRWVGLEAADQVVLGDFPHAQLLPAQADALRGYLVSGGGLIVPVGARWQRLAQSPLADLWPVRLTGTRVASAQELGELATTFLPNATSGADRLGGSPALLAQAAGPWGKVELPEGTGNIKGVKLKKAPGGSIYAEFPSEHLRRRQVPLAARRKVGRGHCLMLRFDPLQPPFIGWRGLEPMWTRVLASTDAPRPLFSQYAEPRQFDTANQLNLSVTADSLFSQISTASQLRLPPVSAVIWYLGLYIFFLVPVNYTVLRLLDKREWAWISIPVIVLVFTVIAYQGALAIRGSAILTRQVDIVQGTVGGKEARLDSALWLFSPRRRGYTLKVDNPTGVVREVQREPGSEYGRTFFEPADARSIQMDSVPMLQWTARNFTASSVVRLGDGILLAGPNGRRLVNKSPFDLSGAALVLDGNIHVYPAVKAGASAEPQSITSAKEPARQIAAAANAPDSIWAGGNKEDVLLSTVTAYISNSTPGFTDTLFAWRTNSMAKIQFEGQPAGSEMTLVALKLEGV